MTKLLMALIMVISLAQLAEAEMIGGWEEYFDRAVNASNQDPKDLRTLVNLRRAWVAVDPKESLTSEPYQKIRKELIAFYTSWNLPALADWYKNSPAEAIDKKMRDKQQEGKTLFQKDWRVRKDEFGMITIWKPESVGPRKQPVYYHYKPGDLDYGEVLTLASPIESGQEKPVDFDLSSVQICISPTLGAPFTIDW